MKNVLAILLLVLGLAGCKSTPAPTPVPLPVAQVRRQAVAASQLSKAQNWPAAASQWQQAAIQFGVLNDRADEALALHNLAQARTALGEFTDAHSILERAAALNLETRNTNEWWRNQIALLQVEAKCDPAAADQRWAQLEPAFPLLVSPGLRGLYLNELGLWRQGQKQYAAAATAFNQAEAAFTQEKDVPSLAVVGANRAWLLENQADYAAARSQWQQALARFEALADASGIGAALAGLGRVALADKQDYAEAEKLLGRAAQNFRTCKMEAELAATLLPLKECLVALKKTEAAAKIQTELDQLKKTKQP